MVTQTIGGHKVEIYDGIDSLPIVRFHKFQKLLLIEAGIGGDIAAFDQRIEKTRRFLMAGKTDKAQAELENLRQCVYMIQSELNPKHLAFAVMVAKIDGRECSDISDDGLRRVLSMLEGATAEELTTGAAAVKKKIDAELIVYFPDLFNSSEVKEYFGILRKRTLAVLNAIIEGRENPEAETEVERITTELMTYANPQKFQGSEGVEIRYDRQFEDLCLSLSEQLHIRPKDCSVLEFYNAFEFLKARARKAERAQKRSNLK